MKKSVVALLLFMATLFTFAACGVSPSAETKPTPAGLVSTSCQAVRAKCLKPAKPGLVGGPSCPQCQTENPDLYMNVQCDGSTGFCDCVDVKTRAFIKGNIVNGKRERGMPDCSMSS